jgi:hypothetical protein
MSSGLRRNSSNELLMHFNDRIVLIASITAGFFVSALLILE